MGLKARIQCSYDAISNSHSTWVEREPLGDAKNLDAKKANLAERGGFEPPVHVLARTTV